MTRVWRCNGWVTWRQRSFEMKRQSVFCSDWWKMVEVLVESLKCSGGQWSVAPQHIISKVCHGFLSGASDCGIYRRGLPVGLRICGRSCGIMVTTSFESRVKLCGRESYLLTFHEFGRWWNMIQSQIEILFGVSGWWSFWRLWSDHNHRRSWDLGSCDFPVISNTLINLQVSDGAGGLGPWQKGFFRFFLRSSTWMFDDVKLALTHLWIPSCLNFWTSNVDP